MPVARASLLLSVWIHAHQGKKHLANIQHPYLVLYASCLYQILCRLLNAHLACPHVLMKTKTSLVTTQSATAWRSVCVPFQVTQGSLQEL